MAEMPSAITQLVFDPSGERLAVGSPDGRLRIVATEGGEVLQTFQNSNASFDIVAISPDGASVLFYAADAWEVRSIEDGMLLARFEGRPGRFARWFPDGERFVTMSFSDQVTTVWSAEGGLLTDIEHATGPLGLHIDGLGRLLVHSWARTLEVVGGGVHRANRKP